MPSNAPAARVRRLAGRQRVDRAPGVEREPVARRPRRARDAPSRRCSPVDSWPKMTSSTSSRSRASSPAVASLDRFGGDVFERHEQPLRERRRAHRRGGAGVAGQPQHDGPQHADQVFRAFRVAGEPEQIVHRAARRFVAGAANFDARGRRTQQAERVDRAGRQRPHVFACRARLHRERAHRIVGGDAGEPAGHHDVAVRRPRGEHAQRHRPRCERAAIERRRDAQRHEILHDERRRAAFHRRRRGRRSVRRVRSLPKRADEPRENSGRHRTRCARCRGGTRARPSVRPHAVPHHTVGMSANSSSSPNSARDAFGK